MNEETRSQLNAWFDGELSPVEQQRAQSLIESDPEAKAYVEELRRTREALKAAHAHPSHAIPEWSQVEARLERPRPAQALTLSRMLLTAAAVMVLGMAVWWPLRQVQVREDVTSGEGLVERVEFVETDLEGATPVVYLDEPSGWTVVWVVESDKKDS